MSSDRSIIVRARRAAGYVFAAAFSRGERKKLARHALLTHLARREGFELHNPHNFWQRDEDYLSVWRRFPESHGIAQERRYNLYFLARSICGLEGDTAECGVFRGAGSFLIMNATQDGADATREHLIFDSFEGLSEPDENDTRSGAEQSYWSKHDLFAPEDRVSKNLEDSGRFKLLKGWIPDRFRDVEDRRFALVHIDVDLYHPTLDSLAFFYDRMVPGGLIICDDYGSELCPGAKQAFDEFFASRPEDLIRLASAQSVVVKR